MVQRKGQISLLVEAFAFFSMLISNSLSLNSYPSIDFIFKKMDMPKRLVGILSNKQKLDFKVTNKSDVIIQTTFIQLNKYQKNLQTNLHSAIGYCHFFLPVWLQLWPNLCWFLSFLSLLDPQEHHPGSASVLPLEFYGEIFKVPKLYHAKKHCKSLEIVKKKSYPQTDSLTKPYKFSK